MIDVSKLPEGIKIPTPAEAFAARPQTKAAAPTWPENMTTPAMLVIAAAQCIGSEFSGKLIDAVWERNGRYGDNRERAVTLNDISDAETDWWDLRDPDLDDLMNIALEKWATIGLVITPCSMFGTRDEEPEDLDP